MCHIVCTFLDVSFYENIIDYMNLKITADFLSICFGYCDYVYEDNIMWALWQLVPITVHF